MEPKFRLLLGTTALMCGCLADNKVEVNIYNGTNSSPEANSSSADFVSAPPGTRMEEMEYGGFQRTFLVHVPPSYDGSRQYPLVLVFHGRGGSAEGIEHLTGFSVLANSDGFIGAYMQGLGKKVGNAPDWNAGDCCGFSLENNVDDGGFTSVVIDSISSKINIDQGRGYATEFSNGRMMAFASDASLTG